MTICQRCQMQPATRQLHQPQGPPVWLCEPCATQTQVFGTMHKLLLPALTGVMLPAVQACPNCHMTWQQLNQTSRIGCPQCYSHFRKPLEATLLRMHGQAAHQGNHPQGPAAEPNSDLRAELEQAVSEERYEDAARLRDQIRRQGEL